MGGEGNSYRRPVLRAAAIILLVGLYGGAGLYTRAVLHTDIIHTHFAYVPIVLAGLWWGRNALWVALLLTGITFALEAAAPGQSSFWNDAARSGFFLIVAGCIGLLSEKAARARQALSLSEERYRLLLDHSLAGVFVAQDGKVRFVNGRLCELLGYEASELLGRPVGGLAAEAETGAEDFPHPGRDAQSRGECRLRGKDGRQIWVELSNSPTHYLGAEAQLFNAYDITARKEAEAKRREYAELARRQEEQLVHSARLAELGEMAASVAHELNQPLTGIRNFAKNALYMIEENAGQPEDVAANLHRIAEQVDRASRIINQMRGLTRKSERIYAPVNLNATLRESVDFIRPQLSLHGIDLRLELAPDLPCVLGDKIRLEQVFLNILTNARQAMEDADERRLGVWTHCERENSGAVVVEISDTGRGFAADDAHKLFTPFFTTKKTGDGTGLGLSISLTIIKEHHGEIEAIGAPGVGSIFKVMLPPAPEQTG
jgi:PAS domain S-box-containing protein